jgi:hypothetical protein
MRPPAVPAAALALLLACGARTPIEGYGTYPPVEPSPTPSPPLDASASKSVSTTGPADATTAPADTTTSESDSAADAGPAVNPATLPPFAIGQCFGSVTSDPNVTCNASGGPDGTACNTELDCEGHTLLMNCADGVCTCLNPGFGDTCYCLAPSDGSCSATSNCCWN